MKISEKVQKIRKKFCIWIGCGKFTLLRREYFPLAVNLSANSPNKSHITRIGIFELYFRQNDEKIRWKCCGEYLSSLWNPLTSWLLNGVLKRGFPDIFLTTSFGVCNFANTEPMRVIFLNNIWEFDVDLRNG